MERRTWRFTLKDLFIVVAILVILALSYMKFSVGNRFNFHNSQFEIVLRGEQQYPFMLDQIKQGDKIYQKGSTTPLGEVSKVEVEPATMENLNTITGEIVNEIVPDRYNIFITMNTSGFESLNGDAIIDFNLITLNQYLVIKTNRISMPIRVVSIENKG
jgi:hypothetical protein